MSYVSFDTETTVTTLHKRKASPFSPENWVVTAGFKHKGEVVKERRFGDARPEDGWLTDILYNSKREKVKLIIGFNIRFDLMHAIHNNPKNLDMWMEYVAEGGQVWCCQLAEYLLNGQSQDSQMLSLDETAPRYGGNVKVDEVKLLWQAGVNTHEIEPELLTRYLCGGLDENGVFQMGDVENTEKVALGQIERARASGQLSSIMLNMGALLFTLEAERNGMYVDVPRGLEIADELRKEQAELTAELNGFVPKDLPFEFNWSSRFHKSALIFGGDVPYAAYQYDTADGRTIFQAEYDLLSSAGEAPELVYASKEETHYLLEGGGTAEIGSWKDEDGPRMQYVSGKNQGEFKVKKVKVPDRSKPKGRTISSGPSRPIYTFTGYVTPKKEWEGADKGVYSTAADVIKELEPQADKVPFLKAFVGLANVAKDLGTYYITEDEKTKERKGMLSLVGDDGIVHHSLNMVNTITGRLSSHAPNLQNVSKGNKSKVKTLFTSRFGEGGRIIASDFSSLEVYVQAILTNCKQLIEDLREGLDLHVVRLAAKEKMPYEEVYKLAKGYTDEQGVKHPPVKEWDYKRTGAKVYSFQRAFGAGNAKIAESTGMTLEEVEALSAAEDKRYPEINLYYSGVEDQIKQNRKPFRTIPHPAVPGVMCHIGTSHFKTPDGKVYTYSEYPAPDYKLRSGITATFMPTEIKNFVVQGSGGEFMKAAMLLVTREFYRRKNFGGRALLVNTVHDAAYLDASEDVALQAAATLHACMLEASTYMEHKFKWRIPVAVPSDTSWGSSMMEEDSIDGLDDMANTIRKDIRSRYLNNASPTHDTAY